MNKSSARDLSYGVYLQACNDKDRGRKNLDDRSHYKKADFLVDTVQAPVPAVGVPSTRDSRFKKGFFRRHQITIPPDQKKLEYDIIKGQRAPANQAARHQMLQYHNNRHGNILAPEADHSHQFLGARMKRAGLSDLERQNKTRQRNTSSRYYAHMSEDDHYRNAQRREDIKRMNNAHSSVLGMGRKDLKSNGVADNFLSHNTPVEHSHAAILSSQRSRRSSGNVLSSPENFRGSNRQLRPSPSRREPSRNDEDSYGLYRQAVAS